MKQTVTLDMSPEEATLVLVCLGLGASMMKHDQDGAALGMHQVGQSLLEVGTAGASALTGRLEQLVRKSRPEAVVLSTNADKNRLLRELRGEG